MGVFKRILSLMLSLVMVASMGTALVFAEGEAGQALGTSYVFGKFNKPAAVGLTFLTYNADTDATNGEVLQLAIHNEAFLAEHPMWREPQGDFTIELSNDVCTLDYFNVAPGKPESTATGIQIVPKKIGTTILTATPVEGRVARIEIKIEKFKDNYFAMIYGEVAAADGAENLSGRTKTCEVSTNQSPITMVHPFHFAEMEGATGRWIKGYALDDKNLTYKLIRQQLGDGNPKVDEATLNGIFKEMKDTSGKKSLGIFPLAEGTFTLSAEITVGGKHTQPCPTRCTLYR